MNIGYFVSSHGFGHAARACAVIEKIPDNNNIFIFSDTPDWFFKNSLNVQYKLIPLKTDIGLVQDSPIHENLEQTLKELDQYLPFNNDLINSLSKSVETMDIQLILCDISPLGIEVAARSGIPSILIENFTWDWIYEHYLSEFPQFARFISIFENIYQKTSLRFSTIPFCQDVIGSMKIPPIFREPKNNRELIREQLQIEDREKLILVTMGGIPLSEIDISTIKNLNKYRFLVPIQGITKQKYQGNLIFLPHNHRFFHPDLVNAADVVVGKLGYSTIAEVYANQKPFLYISRDSFRESEVLEVFVNKKLNAAKIEYQQIFTHSIFNKIDNLLVNRKESVLLTNGSDMIFDKLRELNFPLD